MNKLCLLLCCFLSGFLLPSLAVGETGAVQDKSLLQPDSAKECAICHYSWVDTFYEDHRSTALAMMPTAPEAAAADMCYSCHDGSTVDSRKHIFNDQRHQTGVLPSDKVTIPKIFPLDRDGKMDCATCHSAHGVSTEPGIERTIFLRTSNQNSEMCRMCHRDQGGGPENGHHPLDKTTLTIPDRIVQYGGYRGSEPNRVICESCHVAHGGFSEKRLVLPVDRPSTHPVLCEECHTQKPGRNEDPDKNRFSHSVDVTARNAILPGNWQNQDEIRLGTKGEIVCITCHATHAAKNIKFLLNDQNKKDSLCLQCHADQLDRITGTKHDLTVTAPDAVNINGRTIAQSGPCSCCHLVHTGNGPFMWARDWSGRPDPLTGICRSCHDREKCAQELPVPETGHPPGTGARTVKTSAVLPRYTAAGQPDPDGGVYCSTCHNSHQWDPSVPENKGDPETDGNRSNSFLRIANTESGLCLACHDDQGAVRNTDHDLRETAATIRNLAGETPDQAGLCGTCHLAHNGSSVLMWARPIPSGTTNSPVTALCTECHTSGGCAADKQPGRISHPVDVPQESPMKSDLPLYTETGTKDPAGRVVCSSCHNSHQWNHLDPQIKSKDGTAADSFLRLTAAGNALLCAGCHQDQARIEGTDHDLRITAADYQDRNGAALKDLGLCGPCHTAHNGISTPFVWNMAPGPAAPGQWNKSFTRPDNIMTALCTGCHLENKCAAQKIPKYGLHPDRLFMAMNRETSDSLSSSVATDRFPLYTDRGERSATGNIVCSTCHDPHLWSYRQAGKGPGAESEGSAFNSFLRENVAAAFCAACHGQEAIYKYKYYHQDKGRKKTRAPKKPLNAPAG